jgi:TRAP-type mannitol/chloroaromatic compound transport system permease large subunit
VAPPEVPTLAIYKGVVPFICLQLIALVVVYIYPDIATWLPRAIGW